MIRRAKRMPERFIATKPDLMINGCGLTAAG
jgi:hypothetical protein